MPRPLCVPGRRCGRQRPPGDEECSITYDPVVATAQGFWQGHPINFKRQYVNDCEMHARTGAIFRF